MKTLLIILTTILVAILGNVSMVSVCPTPATIAQAPEQWTHGSIYQITFLDGCPRINDKEVLLSAPLMEAISSIRTDDNTAYGDYAIEYSYIEAEDLYIANIIDEFKEL